MSARHWHEQLRTLDPCPGALAWVADLLTRRPETTLAEAWEACDRPEWLDWVAVRVGLRYRADQAVRDAKHLGASAWLESIRRHVPTAVLVAAWDKRFP